MRVAARGLPQAFQEDGRSTEEDDQTCSSRMGPSHHHHHHAIDRTPRHRIVVRSIEGGFLSHYNNTQPTSLNRNRTDAPIYSIGCGSLVVGFDRS